MRDILLESLYEWSVKPYQYLKKNKAWDLSVFELLAYPETSLGYHLGCFLLKHSFTPQPKLEDHDVFHCLTNCGTTVPEEITMQFYLMGNGKRSIYLSIVIGLGLILYPDKWTSFRHAYIKGKRAISFHQLPFHQLLNEPIATIKYNYLISNL